MSELKIPTVAFEAHVQCADGRILEGRLFVPAGASHHDGPMRAEEFLNEPQPFFPFRPNEGEPLLLNKRQVVVVTVPAAADADDLPDEAHGPARRVTLECGERRLEGVLVLDMPPEHRRVLDFVNRPEPFVALREGGSHHLVLKERITRVSESRTQER